MASVHLGRLTGPVGFTRLVAIKRLHPEYSCEPELVRTFVDEAHLTSRIRHPNVISVLDVLAEGGELFLVMEYVHGMALARLLALARGRNERVPVPVALSIMAGVFAGLEAAHVAVGDDGEPLCIVHRDVSPQNVLVGEDGVARVLDFGIAKAANRVASTTVGQVKGKLRYMSPEQLQGKALDRRSDLYSACVMFWEMLSGRALFDRSDILVPHGGVAIPAVLPPSTYCDAISPELDRLILAGLAPDPARRPESALELAEQIERLGHVATARAVGEWVRSVGRGSLEEDRERVARIQGFAVLTQATPPASHGEPVPLPAPTPRPWADDGSSVRASAFDASGLAGPPVHPAPSRKLSSRVVVLVGSLGTLAALALIAWRVISVPTSAPPTTAGKLEPPAETEPRPSASTPAPEPPPSREPAAPVTSTVTATPTASAKLSVPAFAPKPGKAQPAAKRDQCRVYRADGTFTYLPECLK